MAKKAKPIPQIAPEIAAIGTVHAALKDLNASAQARVLSYVSDLLNITFEKQAIATDNLAYEEPVAPSLRSATYAPSGPAAAASDAEGINSVALRLIKRSGLEIQSLQKIFSIGIDEIDLVTPKVPGSSKREKFHNVLLLKGIAAYLGTGMAKVTHEQLKETALHYNAYDSTNAAKYLKEFGGDWSGSKTSGYTLSPRGLTNGIEIVKSMVAT